MAANRTIDQRVIDIINDQLSVDAKPTDRLIDDLNGDSLDAVEITMLLEEEFAVSIADEEAEKWQTVEDVVETVRGKLQ